jgi:hypothetical protein
MPSGPFTDAPMLDALAFKVIGDFSATLAAPLLFDGGIIVVGHSQL